MLFILIFYIIFDKIKLIKGVIANEKDYVKKLVKTVNFGTPQEITHLIVEAFNAEKEKALLLTLIVLTRELNTLKTK